MEANKLTKMQGHKLKLFGNELWQVVQQIISDTAVNKYQAWCSVECNKTLLTGSGLAEAANV